MAVVILTTAICAYGIASWPLIDDEVPTLVEMGLMELEAAAFSVPGSQIGRLPRAMPVWYAFQEAALSVLPATEFGFRLPSLICAVLTSALAFTVAARWRGLWFASGLSLIILGSPMFVLLAQVNRFYAMPLLLLTTTLVVIAVPGGGPVRLAAAVALAAVTSLSHNITVAVFGFTSVALVGAHLVGHTERAAAVRGVAAAGVTTVLYLSYIRPLVHGWASTGNPTPPLISFAAHSGVVVLGLALFALWLLVTRVERDRSLTWWALLLGASLVFLPIAPVSWNPRYFVFFMPALWVLAAHGVEFLAARCGYGLAGLGVYGLAGLLLAPGLLSHYQDGSRHDYRRAAEVLASHSDGRAPILSDDAETISYYLPLALRDHVTVRTKVTTPPATEFFLVTRANAWAPLPTYPDRKVELLAEISRRRFDQFSHIVRVFRIGARPGE